MTPLYTWRKTGRRRYGVFGPDGALIVTCGTGPAAQRLIDAWNRQGSHISPRFQALMDSLLPQESR